jgi:hypothetical protein
VGPYDAAEKLLMKRKIDALITGKFPELRPGKGITFGDLSAAAVEYAKAHNTSARD